MTGKSKFDSRQIQCRRLFIFLAMIAFGIFAPLHLFAHQSPTTLVFLDVKPESVAMELQMPLGELELAFGHDITQNTETLVTRLRPELQEYLTNHIRPTTRNQPWSVTFAEMQVGAAEQTQSGPYQEITAHLILTPPAGVSPREFVLNYDVIMHQVVTHSALVAVRRDWETGKTGEQPNGIGLIKVDTASAQIYPLKINLEQGSWWSGFTGMIALGAAHIKEGTDHLLFLLVLLLPAPLLVKDGRWANFGGTKYSIARLLKIVTAFTVGHSITLLVGASGWLLPPQQPIEVLIAVSILISAVHAVRPIFSGREIYIAAGFGLVHGLAFATVLSNFNLNAGAMALSILGFNVGIELMQLFVIALVVPWLILLGQTAFYQWIRIGGAVLAAIAALVWIVERVSGSPNKIGGFVQNIAEFAHLGILVLALIALSVYFYGSIKNKTHFAKG